MPNRDITSIETHSTVHYKEKVVEALQKSVILWQVIYLDSSEATHELSLWSLLFISFSISLRAHHVQGSRDECVMTEKIVSVLGLP
jgi:hypothetical protein